jgi:THO complex subunit 6
VSSSGNDVISGGEDGKVLFWDTRKNREYMRCLEPYKNEVCSRPKFGKWVSCVAVDSGEDWLLCGGGPSLSMWHMRSNSPVTTFPSPLSCPTWTTFQEDLILACGTEANVYQWSFGGELKAKIPTSASFLYSAAVLDNSQDKLLSVGGSSNKIDICTNFMYRDFTLSFTCS